MIIDTPGLREAQLWEGEDGLANLFEDIEGLALGCRFTRLRARHRARLRDQDGAGGRQPRRRALQQLPKAAARTRAIAAKSDARIRIEERRKWKQIRWPPKSGRDLKK